MTYFIDYVTLLLINMTAGLVVLSWYIYKGIDEPTTAGWSSAFGIVGLIAFVCGLHMTLTWPLDVEIIKTSFNIPFGEMSIFFGVLFLGAALSISKNWDLFPLSIYAFFAGLAAVILGARIFDLGLTKRPDMSAAGFILAGIGGIMSGIYLKFRSSKVLRIAGSLALAAAAAIWALTGYMAYWSHMLPVDKW